MQAVLSIADHWWTLYMTYTLGKYLAPCFNLLNMMHLLGCITYFVLVKNHFLFFSHFISSTQLLSTYCPCNRTSWASCPVHNCLQSSTYPQTPRGDLKYKEADSWQGITEVSQLLQEAWGLVKEIDLITWESFRVKKGFLLFAGELLKIKNGGDFYPAFFSWYFSFGFIHLC